MDQRVITEWCQPLRSSKNTNPPKRQLSIGSFCVPGSSSSKVLNALADECVKDLLDCPRNRRPTEMEFESDNHKFCLWLRVENEQEDSPRHSRGRWGRAVEK